MPRNSSGTYTLPAGNPVIPNTLIETTWANPTMADLGAAITDSLDRFGRGGMLAQLKLADGTLAQPAFAFNSESSTGLLRPSAATLQVAVLGSLIATFATAGITAAVPLNLSGGLNITAGNVSINPGNLTVAGTATFSSAVSILTAGAGGELNVTNTADAAEVIVTQQNALAAGYAETRLIANDRMYRLTGYGSTHASRPNSFWVNANDAGTSVVLAAAGLERVRVDSALLDSAVGARIRGGAAMSVGTTGLYLTGGPSTPEVLWNNSAGAADTKVWGAYVDPTVMHFRGVNDALNASADWMTVTRAGMAFPSVVFPISNVGIGSTPVDSMSYGGRVFDVAGPGYFRQGGTPTNFFAAGVSAGVIYLQASPAVPMAFAINSVERMRLSAAGNFLVARTTEVGPSRFKLQVGDPAQAHGALINGSDQFQLAFQMGAGGNYYIGASSSAAAPGLQFSNNVATARFNMSDAGVFDMLAGSGSLRVAGHITRFETAQQLPPVGGQLVGIGHGGTRAPDAWSWFLRCVIAEHGWSVGDIISIADNDISDTSRNFQNISNATTVYFLYSAIAGLQLAIRPNNPASAPVTITNANWRIFAKGLWL